MGDVFGWHQSWNEADHTGLVTAIVDAVQVEFTAGRTSRRDLADSIEWVAGVRLELTDRFVDRLLAMGRAEVANRRILEHRIRCLVDEMYGVPKPSAQFEMSDEVASWLLERARHHAMRGPDALAGFMFHPDLVPVLKEQHSRGERSSVWQSVLDWHDALVGAHAAALAGVASQNRQEVDHG